MDVKTQQGVRSVALTKQRRNDDVKNFLKKYIDEPFWDGDVIALLPTLVYAPKKYALYGYRRFTLQWFGVYINFGKVV